MNWDTVKGDWKKFTGKVREKWGDFTDDELEVARGKREQSQHDGENDASAQTLGHSPELKIKIHCHSKSVCIVVLL